MTSNAYYLKSNVRLEGAHKIYWRTSTAGRWLDHHFCPDRGTTICWTLEVAPESFGVPVGLFNDPDFPAPSVSAWEKTKYAWIPEIPAAEHFARQHTASPQS